MSIFGDIAKSAGSVVKGLPLSGQMLSGLNAIPMSDQRKAFIAVMVATAAGVGQKPNFNLEVEINDLWIRLGSLRQANSDTFGGVNKGIGGMLTPLIDMQTQLNGAMQALVKNMK